MSYKKIVNLKEHLEYEKKEKEIIIAKTLNDNPELKSMQFLESAYYEFTENKDTCIKLVTNGRFDELTKYKGIHLLYAKGYNILLTHIIDKCINVDHFKQIINNSID